MEETLLRFTEDHSMGIDLKYETYDAVLEVFSRNKEWAPKAAELLLEVSMGEPVENAEETVQALGEFCRRFEDNDEMALYYAKGLCHLSGRQGLDAAEKSVRLLGEVFGKYPRNEEIAKEYGRALFNLCLIQPLQGAEESMHRYNALKEKFKWE